MRPFSFLHCADIHLGAPFRGLGDLPDALSETLLDASTKAFHRAVLAGIERHLDAVVIAGDLFDAADRNLRAQIQLRDELQRLEDAGIATFVAAGNHDHLGGKAASIEYPDSVHMFGPEVECLPLVRDGEVIAHVYGISYSGPRQMDGLVSSFPEEPEGPFAIGVLHANVGDRPGHDNYAPCSLDELRSTGFDYWALGHVHTRETLSKERPVVHYPGNPQGLHSRETGPRGVTLVDVAANGSVTLTPLWTDVVRWHRRRTSIADLNGLDDLLAAFDEVAGDVLGQATDRVHVVRWTLTGRGPLHRELRDGGFVEDLTERLRQEHLREGGVGTVWLERLGVATRPDRDLETLRSRQDLLGDILRLAREARECADRPPQRELGTEVEEAAEPAVCESLRGDLRELLDNHRLRNALGQSAWDAVSWPALLLRAENLAVEALGGDEDESGA